MPRQRVVFDKKCRLQNQLTESYRLIPVKQQAIKLCQTTASYSLITFQGRDTDREYRDCRTGTEGWTRGSHTHSRHRLRGNPFIHSFHQRATSSWLDAVPTHYKINSTTLRRLRMRRLSSSSYQTRGTRLLSTQQSPNFPASSSLPSPFVMATAPCDWLRNTRRFYSAVARFSSTSSPNLSSPKSPNPPTPIVTAAPSERPNKHVTIHTLRQLKAAGTPISMVTAYDFPSAVHVDVANIDVLLVGDSVGMVELGFDTTLPVTMEQMIHHCQVRWLFLRFGMCSCQRTSLNYMYS